MMHDARIAWCLALIITQHESYGYPHPRDEETELSKSDWAQDPEIINGRTGFISAFYSSNKPECVLLYYLLPQEPNEDISVREKGLIEIFLDNKSYKWRRDLFGKRFVKTMMIWRQPEARIPHCCLPISVFHFIDSMNPFFLCAIWCS